MKKIKRIIFFLLLSLISTRALFHRGVPVTHDGNNHLVRFANYYLAIKELQFPPRLAPNLLNHYGYPVFNFNYPLANILSLPLTVLGFHYQLSFKIIFLSFVILGIIGAELWLKEKKFSKKTRNYALTLFALTPYLITTIIFRGNVGEVMSWGILPWVFYFLERISKEKKREMFLNNNFFGLNFFLILLFLSHNITAFFASGIIFFYLIFLFKNNWQQWTKFLLSFVLSFISCLWFWLPAMLEKQFTILDNVDLTLNYYKHFPSLKQLLAVPIEFGYSYWGEIDSMTFGLGLGQIVIVLLAVIFVLKNLGSEKLKKNTSLLFLFFALIIFQLPFTRVVYDLVPMAEFIQFPWRLALLFSIVSIPISALFFEELKPGFRRFLLFLLVIQLWQFISLRPIDYTDKAKIDYDFFADTTSVNKENMPKTFIYQDFYDWEATPKISDDSGEIRVEKWRGSSRSYQLKLTETSTVIEPSAYFVGWETKYQKLGEENWQKLSYIDNKEIQGRIAYQLEAGEYKIRSRFTQHTWPRLLGNGLSAISLLLLSAFYLFSLKKEKNKAN